MCDEAPQSSDRLFEGSDRIRAKSHLISVEARSKNKPSSAAGVSNLRQRFIEDVILCEFEQFPNKATADVLWICLATRAA